MFYLLSLSVYHVPNWDIVTKLVKTHTAANCACRSPGTLPAIFISESMMDHVACSLQLDVEAVKRANFYQKDQVTSLKIHHMVSLLVRSQWTL